MANENEKPAMGEEVPVEPEAVEMTAEELRAELAKEKSEKAKTAAALGKANDEAKKRRLRLEELEEAEAEREKAKLSDDEKAKRANAERDQKARDAESRAAKAEQSLLAERVERAVEREAIRMEFTYPDIVPSLVDRSMIETDPDTGRISGVKQAVEKVAKDKPDLLRAKPGGGSPAAIARGRGGNPPQRGREAPSVHQELLDTGRYNV